MEKFENILDKLSQEFSEYHDTMERNKTTLTYIPWYHVQNILDTHAPTWQMSIEKVEVIKGRDKLEDLVYVTVTISIEDQESGKLISRTNIGWSELYEERLDRDANVRLVKPIAYGDPFSNALSMAMRRAAVNFGPGRYLYDKEKRARYQQQAAPQQQYSQQGQGQARQQGTQQIPQNCKATSVEDLASPRQLVAIRAIANAQGTEPESYCRQTCGVDIGELSRRAASALIDNLKSRAADSSRS